MMFMSMEVNSDERPNAISIEDTPKVRCCISLRSPHVERVGLLGDFCASGEELVLSEPQPGIWMAWLLLRPGRYQCTLVARMMAKCRSAMDVCPRLLRKRFTLTIPDIILVGSLGGFNTTQCNAL